MKAKSRGCGKRVKKYAQKYAKAINDFAYASLDCFSSQVNSDVLMDHTPTNWT